MVYNKTCSKFEKYQVCVAEGEGKVKKEDDGFEGKGKREIVMHGMR